MATATNCPKCNSDDLLVVRLVPKDRPMQFHTCRHCEHRWWEDADSHDDLDLEVVIDEMAR